MIAAASIAAAIALAPTARADEQSYINELEASGHGFYGNTMSFLALGYGVCGLAGNGWTQGELATWVVANSGQGIYYPEAMTIVRAAEIYLC